jgi:hypothetical protein
VISKSNIIYKRDKQFRLLQSGAYHDSSFEENHPEEVTPLPPAWHPVIYLHQIWVVNLDGN